MSSPPLIDVPGLWEVYRAVALPADASGRDVSRAWDAFCSGAFSLVRIIDGHAARGDAEAAIAECRVIAAALAPAGRTAPRRQ